MSLSAEQKEKVQRMYDRQKKSVAIAYLLWFLLWVHHGYLGKWPTQILFWLTVGGVFVWWIIDAVRMQTLVNNYNDALERRLPAEVVGR